MVSITGGPSLVGVRGVGEASVTDGGAVCRDRAGHRPTLAEEVLDELRRSVAGVQAEHVVQHEDLTVAPWPGADPCLLYTSRCV